MRALYDRIGTTYRATRCTDPRLAALIWAALGDARSVLNVGAGTGSYEPQDRDVLAVEPSATMISQRPHGAAAAIQASAEELPLPDQSYDAALAVNTVHHWQDITRASVELRRVIRCRVVVFMNVRGEPFWLEHYFPQLTTGAHEMDAVRARLEAELGPLHEQRVALPFDCTDGLLTAYWGRPEAYLDASVRANISPFAKLTLDDEAAGIERLATDLASGAWDRRHGHLRELPELHLGHRILVAEFS